VDWNRLVGLRWDDGGVRSEPSILHVDLDAFFAAVEQRDKPSLRGKPVVVGGLGPRGVVSTASYEARTFGVHSAMPTREARSRCPNAAYLFPRFRAYSEASTSIMALLRDMSPLVEPLSLDEAFVDLAAAPPPIPLDAEQVRRVGSELRASIMETTGLTASVGAGTSKFIAKLASDLSKPDGLQVVDPGSELELLRPLPVTRLWGVGPATAARLHRAGLHLIGELERVSMDELIRLVGQSLGAHLHRLARAEDDRPVVAERESKSVSVEDTFDRDISDSVRLAAILDILTSRLVRRMTREGLSGRTVTVKVRLHDFTTLSRSYTLPGPTDDARTIARVARRLLADVDSRTGVRLLGVGMSALADWVQGDLFDFLAAEEDTDEDPVGYGEQLPAGPYRPRQAAAIEAVSPGATAPGPQAVRAAAQDGQVAAWLPGQDVLHDTYGPGWVWGSRRGLVTIRFETPQTGPGPIRTVPADDPGLHHADRSEDSAG
jgi:DNA polymerase IV